MSKCCPEGRLSKPTRKSGQRDIVDIETYAPFFLSAVNNALTHGASKLYRKEVGIGVVEWRIVSMLAIEPGIKASRICEVIHLDKAATSRGLSLLADQSYLIVKASEKDPRDRKWRLSKKGYELHDGVLQLALERERRLIQGVEPEDFEAFLRVMRLMRRNLDSF